MGFEYWHIWIILAILLFIIEIFTATFLTACLAIGCLLAGIFSYLNFEINTQLLVFSIGTLLAFFGIRPFMLKYVHSSDENVKTNADAIKGKIGFVAEIIDNSKGTGRVTINGDNWRAETLEGEILKVGERVCVVDLRSTILIVKSMKIQ